jgi:uncharacterized repeat protein (TIGR04076 family)
MLEYFGHRLARLGSFVLEKSSQNCGYYAVYNYPEDRGKLCPSSFHIMFPWILVMQSGGHYGFFDDDGNSVTLGCSDYDHQVVYKITREVVDESS